MWDRKVNLHTQFITECTALVHDIGIRLSEQKYDKCNEKLQEQEGDIYAYNMLNKLNFNQADGAVGALLADCLTGFAIWAPASVIIKSLAVLCFSRKNQKIVYLSVKKYDDNYISS